MAGGAFSRLLSPPQSEKPVTAEFSNQSGVSLQNKETQGDDMQPLLHPIIGEHLDRPSVRDTESLPLRSFAESAMVETRAVALSNIIVERDRPPMAVGIEVQVSPTTLAATVDASTLSPGIISPGQRLRSTMPMQAIQQFSNSSSARRSALVWHSGSNVSAVIDTRISVNSAPPASSIAPSAIPRPKLPSFAPVSVAVAVVESGLALTLRIDNGGSESRERLARSLSALAREFGLDIGAVRINGRDVAGRFSGRS